MITAVEQGDIDDYPALYDSLIDLEKEAGEFDGPDDEDV